MIDLATARQRIQDHVRTGPIGQRDLLHALGCRLAEDIQSPIDSPPYDKSMVDGYAIRAADVHVEGCELTVIEEVFAGQVASRQVLPGTAIRIMTGAPVPAGADSVVMVETTESLGAKRERVKINALPARQGQHILRRGTTIVAGDRVLSAGCELRPVELGLLAEIGRSQVQVVQPPRVALLQTGDELVAPGEVLGPGQIRNSNGILLTSLVQKCGGVPWDLGPVCDEEGALREKIETGLGADVLLVSGGVSMGDRDLVPATLQDLGVTCVFHRVHLRPGQPVWFGYRESRDHRTLVFGLPGNPVSGLVCFLALAAPALRWLAGHAADWTGETGEAVLGEPFYLNGARPAYWPVVAIADAAAVSTPVNGTTLDAAALPTLDATTRTTCDRLLRTIRVLPWQGSADLRTLCDATGLAFFPEGNRNYDAGEHLRMLDF